MPRRQFKDTVLIRSTFTINKAPLIVKLVRGVCWVPEGFAKNGLLLYNVENMLNGLGPHLLPSDLYSPSSFLFRTPP